MLVKIKKEVITMRMPLIKPELGRARWAMRDPQALVDQAMTTTASRS